MRIGIDIQTLETFERHRGIGRLCLATVRALLAHASSHEMVLFGRSASPPAELAECLGSRVQYAQIRLPADPATYLEDGCVADFLWETPEAREIDLYHVTSPFMADIVLPATAPCPIVATLLDAIPAVMHERRRPILDSQQWQRYRQRVRVARQWQAFAAISHATAEDCIRLFDLDPHRVVVTYVPVEPRPLAGWTDERRAAVLQRYDLRQGFVLSVTGYHPRKNFEALLGAYGRLSSSLKRASPLVVVCSLSETERQNLQALAKRCNCAEEVRWLGFVPDEDFPAIMAAARVMFFPSRYEGFGLPVAEAMAAGVPVVTSNRASLPEVVGEAGMMADPDDHRTFARALEEILTSDRQYAELRARGFIQVAKFSPSQFAERLVRTYEKACTYGDGLSRPDAPPQQIRLDTSSGRLRVAMFTPLSPKLSGIADFAEQLLLNFSQNIHVECFVEDYVPAHPLVRQRIEVFPHWRFLSRHAEAPFDVTLYELGNNLLHAYMLPYMQHFPGVVDLHDFSILGLFQLLARDYGWGELARQWYMCDAHSEYSPRSGAIGLEHRDPLQAPMTRQLLRKSRGVVVHSLWLRDHVSAILPEPVDVEQIPLGVDLGMVRAPRPPLAELRRKYHLSPHSFVVACVGVANRLKRLPQVLAAFRDFNLVCPESYLVFVGPADRVVLRQVTQLAASYRLKNRLRIFGHRPLPEFYEVLDLADVIVNLRYPTMGEASATLAAALAMGKPVLVSSGGQFAEFPDDVCPKVPVDRHEQRTLCTLLCALYERPELRRQLADNARRFVQDWAFHRIAVLYENFLIRAAHNHRDPRAQPAGQNRP